MDNAVKIEHLVWGRWKKIVRLEAVLITRMGQAWLNHHHSHGSSNWDITLAKLLSISLVATLRCRGGDVARSHHYSDAYCLQYRHIDLVLDNDNSMDATTVVKPP